MDRIGQLSGLRDPADAGRDRRGRRAGCTGCSACAHVTSNGSGIEESMRDRSAHEAQPRTRTQSRVHPRGGRGHSLLEWRHPGCQRDTRRWGEPGVRCRRETAPVQHGIRWVSAQCTPFPHVGGHHRAGRKSPGVLPTGSDLPCHCAFWGRMGAMGPQFHFPAS